MIGKLENEFLELMPATITVEPFLNQDRYTEANYGKPYKVRARVEQTNREYRMPHGLIETAAAVVYPFNTPVAITAKDRITLPDGSTPPILGVIEEWDENGFHHYEIYCSANAPRA